MHVMRVVYLRLPTLSHLTAQAFTAVSATSPGNNSIMLKVGSPCAQADELDYALRMKNEQKAAAALTETKSALDTVLQAV